MPIEPIDPSKKPDGDGQEKYPAKPKHGPGKFDEFLEKAKTDRLTEKEQIRKMGDALDKAGVPLPRPDTFPKTTAAFEAMAKSDAERAERRAARGAASSLDEFNAKTSKGGGGGGAGIPKVGPRRPTDMKKGGAVSSASKRADGCAIRGKTRA
jgi:hypothetical protein